MILSFYQGWQEAVGSKFLAGIRGALIGGFGFLIIFVLTGILAWIGFID